MTYIIPKDINTKIYIYKGITVKDILIALTGVFLLSLILSSNIHIKLGLALLVLSLYCPMFITLNGERLYTLSLYILRYIISYKRYTSTSKRANISVYKGYEIKDNYLKNQDGSYSLFLHITPPCLDLKSNIQKESYSYLFSTILTRLEKEDELRVIKLEEDIDLIENMQAEKERAKKLLEQDIKDEELESRLQVIEARFNNLIDQQDKGYKQRSYYIQLTSAKLDSVQDLAMYTLEVFQDGGIKGEILDRESLLDFVDKYSEDINGESIKFNLKSYISNKEKVIYTSKEYPTQVVDNWAGDIFNIPNTKTIMSFKKADSLEIIKKIDSTLLTLSQANTEKASEVSKRENQIETLQNMLDTLSRGEESAVSVNIYVIANSNNKKDVKRELNKEGFVFNESIGKIRESFLGTLLGNFSIKEKRRIMQTSVAGASFPFNANIIKDPKGIYIGESAENTIYKDFFILDEDHLNSNMVILGKSGAGKSYFSKALITNLAADNTKIFILDPEGEYKRLTKNLGGEIIDTSFGEKGRINPFENILDEDISSHLRFLDEMYKTIFQGISQEAINILNEETAKMYEGKQNPTFTTLYLNIQERLKKEQDLGQISILKTLINHMGAMLNGLVGKLWNGETNINTNSRIIDIDFSKLLLERNQEITNAEMLIVLHYIMCKLSQNIYGDCKVVVVIDEAHLFVDNKYSAALDFMYQLAKRIRKYNGMQIVITQNIKDFVGSQEIIKKTSSVINASQYSVLFALSPQDITDALKLYENAGGFSEYEKSLLTYAQRGEALMILSPKEHVQIKVKTLNEIKKVGDIT